MSESRDKSIRPYLLLSAMKPARPAVVALVLVMCLCYGSGGRFCAAAIVLDEDTATVILLGNAATLTEQFAAKELQRYVEAITDIHMPIRKGAPENGDLILAVGETDYSAPYLNRFDISLTATGRDSFLIKVQDKLVILAGGADRGTLYSVYEFLEQQGCRWFFPGSLGEVIPSKERLVLPVQEEYYRPDFVQRSIDVGPVEGIPIDEIIDWGAKNRLNWMFSCRDYFIEKQLPRENWDIWKKRGEQLQWQRAAHNLGWMVPTTKYFAEHPEYYSLYQGERMGISKTGIGGGNLCTTHPEVIRLCADFIIDWFDKNPDGQVVPLWPSDGEFKWCECRNCAKLGGENSKKGPEGSMTRRMVTFANAVARLVYPKYPDRYILCPAYSMYVEPVPDIPLEKNILVQFCLYGCYAHGVDQCDENAKYIDLMQPWTQVAAGRIGVWEYFLIGDFTAKEITPALLPVTYRARDNIRYLKNAGFSFYFTQARSEYWKHNILPYYVTARLIWDTQLDFDLLWDDFFEKMYGPAADPVKTLYRLMEDSVKAADWHPQMYRKMAPSALVYTESLLDEADSLLRMAEAMTLSGTVRERLVLVREAVEYLEANVSTSE